MRRGVLRILDANYNRAKEAARVIEDLIRFLWNDRGLAAKAKGLRHRMTRCLLAYPVPYRELVACRDSARDVGKAGATEDRAGRCGPQDLMIRNFKRAQESLRVLEEMSSLVAPAERRQFQKLRFDYYEFEKKVLRKF